MFSPWWPGPPWMEAPHQQHRDWETWTWGHSQTEPRTRGSSPPAPIPHSIPGIAVPARACARHSRLKHRGGLCCYYQPYTATLAVEAMRAEDVSLLELTGERAMRRMCEKRPRNSNGIILLLVLLSCVLEPIWKQTTARQGSSFTHLYSGRDDHKHSTTQHRQETRQAVLGVQGIMNDTRRTQVTLHYCSLLFHCFISQRLCNMHAFP